ncbi:MAG: hypothetical protein ABIG89_06385 [Candidatus Woesearchaeota archaeon]
MAIGFYYEGLFEVLEQKLLYGTEIEDQILASTIGLARHKVYDLARKEELEKKLIGDESKGYFENQIDMLAKLVDCYCSNIAENFDITTQQNSAIEERYCVEEIKVSARILMAELALIDIDICYANRETEDGILLDETRIPHFSVDDLNPLIVDYIREKSSNDLTVQANMKNCLNKFYQKLGIPKEYWNLFKEKEKMLSIYLESSITRGN